MSQHPYAILARRRSTLQGPPGGRPPTSPTGAVDTPTTTAPPDPALQNAEKRIKELEGELASMGPKHVALGVGGFILGAIAAWAVLPTYQKNPAWKPGAFDKRVNELMAQGHSEDSARRIAASIGRQKYGQAEMTHRSQMGKKAAKKGRS